MVYEIIKSFKKKLVFTVFFTISLFGCARGLKDDFMESESIKEISAGSLEEIKEGEIILFPVGIQGMQSTGELGKDPNKYFFEGSKYYKELKLQAQDKGINYIVDPCANGSSRPSEKSLMPLNEQADSEMNFIKSYLGNFSDLEESIKKIMLIYVVGTGAAVFVEMLKKGFKDDIENYRKRNMEVHVTFINPCFSNKNFCDNLKDANPSFQYIELLFPLFSDLKSYKINEDTLTYVLKDLKATFAIATTDDTSAIKSLLYMFMSSLVNVIFSEEELQFVIFSEKFDKFVTLMKGTDGFSDNISFKGKIAKERLFESDGNMTLFLPGFAGQNHANNALQIKLVCKVIELSLKLLNKK